MPTFPLGAAGSGSLVFFVLLLFGGFAVAAIVAAVRKNRETSEEDTAAARLRSGTLLGATVLPYAINVTLGLDGFWLHGDTVPKGALIIYVYLCDAQTHTGHVHYRPGAMGQFVYTGGKPESVEVRRIIVDDPSAREIESYPSDGPNYDAPVAAAWFATQNQPSDSSPAASDRSDPPAY